MAYLGEGGVRLQAVLQVSDDPDCAGRVDGGGEFDDVGGAGGGGFDVCAVEVGGG
ncbi:hypothetical protein [Solwaraspora sp. WMMA2101]|uniref:hypothetical protein n=1 Tax=Solwaraspora sp. WMMA2101 TaxID=3404124 RepID=UPI003B95CF80